MKETLGLLNRFSKGEAKDLFSYNSKEMAYRRALEIRKICCSNCGVEGHMFRDCDKPITSYGIIALKKDLSESDPFCSDSPVIMGHDIMGPPQVLLICRRDSLSFIEFVRGKYSVTERDYLYVLLQNMTKREHEKIRHMTFDELWRSVWGSAADTHKNDYEISERKYAAIAEGNISKLLDAYPTVWLEPEWGFPKGRRNSGETEIQAAVREFEEETNINRSHLYTVQNIRPFVETFYGSNNVQYCHKYFVSMCDNVTLNVIQDNPHMNREIGSIGWFTIDQAIEKIRPDSKEKRELLLIVKELMRTLCPVII